MRKKTGREPEFSIVTVSQDEAEYIPLALLNIDRRIEDFGRNAEVIVVNSGSNDGSGMIIRRMSESIPFLRVIDIRDSVKSYEAMRHGTLVAEGHIRLIGSLQAIRLFNEFEDCLRLLGGGVDVVSINYRFHKTRGFKNFIDAVSGAWREFIDRLSMFIVLRRQISKHPSLLLMRSEIAKELFALCGDRDQIFDPLEFLALAHKLGYTVREICAEHSDFDAVCGVKERSAGWRMLVHACVVRWRLMNFLRYYGKNANTYSVGNTF